MSKREDSGLNPFDLEEVPGQTGSADTDEEAAAGTAGAAGARPDDKTASGAADAEGKAREAKEAAASGAAATPADAEGATDADDAWDEGSRPDDTFWAEGTDWTETARPLAGEDTLADEAAEGEGDAAAEGGGDGTEGEGDAEDDGTSEGPSPLTGPVPKSDADADGSGSAPASDTSEPATLVPLYASATDDDLLGARAALASLGGPRDEATRVLSCEDLTGSGAKLETNEHEPANDAAENGKPATSDGEGVAADASPAGSGSSPASAGSVSPAANSAASPTGAGSASPAAGTESSTGASVDLGETRPGGIPVDETTVIPHASDRPDSSRKARRAAKYYYPKYYQPSRFGRIPYVVAIVVLTIAVVCLGISTAWYSGAITRYTGYGRQSAGIFADPDTNDQRFMGKLAIAQGSDGTTYQDLLYLDAQANGDATAYYRGTLLSGRLVQVASDQDTVTYQLQGTATQGGDTVTNATLTLCLPLGLTAENLAGTWRTSLVTADQTLSNWGTIKDDGTATANATDKYDIFNPGDKSTRESYTYTWSTADDGKVTLAPNRASSYFTLKVWM